MECRFESVVPEQGGKKDQMIKSVHKYRRILHSPIFGIQKLPKYNSTSSIFCILNNFVQGSRDLNNRARGK